MSAPGFQARRLNVVHVSVHADAEQRGADELMRAWPTLSGVARAAARAGVDVTVVQNAHKNETLDRNGVVMHFVDDGRAVPTRVIEQVAALRPDIVHVQGLNFPRAMRALSHAVPRAPLLVQDHGAVVPTGWRAHAWRWAHRVIGGVAFTSREQAIPWQRTKIFRADLPVFEVIEGSTEFTPGDQDAVRAATGMSGAPCLLWTGRLDANKDPMTMLAAVESAARVIPDLRLWCCFGTSALLGDMQRRIAQSPLLKTRVTLLGTRPHHEMEARFRAADFFVQTSHHEGSGYSLIEALACGTTPLVTDIPAFRRIVGDAGSVTPVADSAALGKAIVAWSARDRTMNRHRARARFDDALSFDVIGRELRHAYESLAMRSPARNDVIRVTPTRTLEVSR